LWLTKVLAAHYTDYANGAKKSSGAVSQQGKKFPHFFIDMLDNRKVRSAVSEALPTQTY
jgi:hypothetical protein